MIRKIIAISLFLILLNGCASTLTSSEAVIHEKPDPSLSQKEKWKNMVGKWFGEQPTKEGGKRQWIVERASNGTYKITFRVYRKDGVFSESAEVGQWAVSGPVYMTLFRGHLNGRQIDLVDPSDSYNYDAYEILVLNKTTFKYKSFEYNETFTTIKVKNNFVFPE